LILSWAIFSERLTLQDEDASDIALRCFPFSGNFLFDFRTSALCIDRTAFLGKVLADFVPHRKTVRSAICGAAAAKLL